MQITEALTESSIAVRLSSQESGLGRPLASLAGQMGCIYLFDDVLTPGESLSFIQIFICNPRGKTHEDLSNLFLVKAADC